jgi:hypothetical protein
MSNLKKCEGESAMGYPRRETGSWNTCESWLVKPRAKEICDGLYNAPWIGSSRVICNADPKFYWGTSDCDMTPDNEGTNLCWQCQPGEHWRTLSKVINVESKIRASLF